MTKTTSIEITAEIVATGARLDAALLAIDTAKHDAHKAALALKAALCPKGKPKGADGKFLPHVVEFLDAVFADFAGSNAARKMRRTRLMQVIASTTETSLGKTQDADAKRSRGRKPRPGTVAASDNVTEDGDKLTDDNEHDNEHGNEPSKSAEKRAAIRVAVKAVETELHALQIGSISRLAGEARKGANAQLDKVRAALKALAAMID